MGMQTSALRARHASAMHYTALLWSCYFRKWIRNVYVARARSIFSRRLGIFVLLPILNLGTQFPMRMLFFESCILTSIDVTASVNLGCRPKLPSRCAVPSGCSDVANYTVTRSLIAD